jgi:hypothetical protein
MNVYQREEQLKAKLTELRRTIQFLCNTMDNVADLIDKDPSMAKFMLRDSQNDQRYEFR